MTERMEITFVNDGIQTDIPRKRFSTPKKIPGSMIPRKLPDVPENVKTIQAILTKLGDFTIMTEEDDLNQNIQDLAKVFAEVGDLNEFPDQISDIFIKCFEQLSPQVPIYSTILALLHNIHNQTEFTTLVIQKLQSHYIEHLGQGRIVTAKLLLRVLVCLTCCKAFALEGSGSMLEILESLYLVVENGLPTSAEEDLPEESAECAFLLANALLWSVEMNGHGVFTDSATATAFLAKCSSLFHSILQSYSSPFGVNGRQAMLYRYSLPVTEDGAAPPIPLGLGVPANGVADMVWQSLTVCVDVLTNGLQSSREATTAPRGMLRPWTVLEMSESQTSSVMPLRFSDEFESQFLGLLVVATGNPDSVVASDNPVCGLGLRATHSLVVGESAMYGRGCGWNTGRAVFFTGETNAAVQWMARSMTGVEKYLLLQCYEDILCYFDPVINPDGTKLGGLDLLATHLYTGVDHLFNGPGPALTSTSMEDTGGDTGGDTGENTGGDEAVVATGNESVVAGGNESVVAKTQPQSLPLATEYVLVETLFQHLLLLPGNSMHALYIARLIVWLCKKYPAVPPVVALATSVLYLMLPDVNALSTIHSLSEWFSFHLINTAFQWPFWDFMLDEAGLLPPGNYTDTAEDTGEQSGGQSGGVSGGVQGVYPAFFAALSVRWQLLLSVEHYGNALPRELVSVFPFSEQSLVPASPFFLRRGPDRGSSGVVVTLQQPETSDKHQETSDKHHEKTHEKLFIGALFHSFTTNAAIHSFAQEMKARIQARIHCEELIDWLESLPPLAEEGNEVVYSRVLLEAMLYVAYEGETLTVLVGLLDTYHDVLVAVGDSALAQLVMIETVFTLYPLISPASEVSGSGQSLVIVDEMLRRGQLQPQYVVTYLVSLPVTLPVTRSSVYWKVWNLAIDRTLDVVKGSLLHRRKVSDNVRVPALSLDAEADLTPSQPPILATTNALENGGESGGEDGGGKRRRKGGFPAEKEEEVDVDYEAEDTPMMSDETGRREEMSEEMSDDPTFLATEAVKAAVSSARTVYAITVRHVVQQLVAAQEGATPGSEEDWKRNLLVSFLQRTWRAFFGLQNYFSFPVVLLHPLVHRECVEILRNSGHSDLAEVLRSWKKYL